MVKILCTAICFFMACFCCLAEGSAPEMLSVETEMPMFDSHWLSAGKQTRQDIILPDRSPGPLSLTRGIYEPLVAVRSPELVNFSGKSPFGDSRATNIIAGGVIGALLGAGGMALGYNLFKASEEGPGYSTSSSEQQNWVLAGAVIGAVMGIYIAATSD